MYNQCLRWYMIALQIMEKELILANYFNINFFINRKRQLEKHKEDQ